MEVKGALRFITILLILHVYCQNSNASISSPSGTWLGSYSCGQGRTGLTLKINVIGSDVSAVFSFYPVTSNPSIPSGSFELRGTIAGNKIILKKYRWISKPTGYNMLDLTLDWNEKKDVLTGKICGYHVELKREGSPLSYQPQVVKTETKKESAFKISAISGTLWLASWKSNSGWDEMGVKMDYNIKPSLASGYSINSQFRRGSIMLNYIYSRAESSITHDITSNISPILKRTIKLLAKRSFGDFFEVEVGVMHSTFKGDIIIDHAQVFQLPDYTVLDLNSKWFMGDLLFKWHDSRYPKLKMAVGYRHTNYKKPLAFALFYGTVNEDDKIVADELISGTIEHSTITGHYFTVNADIVDDLDAIRDKRFNLFYGTMFGGGVNNINGTSSSIKNAVAFVSDFWGGFSYAQPVRDSYLRFKFGYKINLHLSPSCEFMYEMNGKNAYYGSYIWENMHGPYITLELLR